MRIVKEAKRVEMIRYFLSFRYVAHPGSGFAFDCNKNGKPVLGNDAARQNYAMCLAGGDGILPIIREGIKEEHWSYMDPAVGMCICGRRVTLGGFTNTCECGTEFNNVGQQLAPRAHWGEETGESF